MDIHLSVQANAVNWATVKFWKQMGLTRVILSRELSLEEIEEIRTQVPDMEIEIRPRRAVHGLLRPLPALGVYQQTRSNGAPAPTPAAGSTTFRKAKRTTSVTSCTSTNRSR